MASVGIKVSKETDPRRGHRLGQGPGLFRIRPVATKWIGAVSVSVDIVENECNLAGQLSAHTQG
jgi:hypothetical protein